MGVCYSEAKIRRLHYDINNQLWDVPFDLLHLMDVAMRVAKAGGSLDVDPITNYLNMFPIKYSLILNSCSGSTVVTNNGMVDLVEDDQAYQDTRGEFERYGEWYRSATMDQRNAFASRMKEINDGVGVDLLMEIDIEDFKIK